MNTTKSSSTIQQQTNITSKQRSPKQILQQDICQKYGWSCNVDVVVITTTVTPENQQELCSDHTNETTNEKINTNDIHTDDSTIYNESIQQQQNEKQQKTYTCTIIIGYQQQYIYTSNISETNVYEIAINELQKTIIPNEEIKPIITLQELYSTLNNNTIPIYDSHDRKNWDYFWNHKPNVVGIDTEGNSINTTTDISSCQPLILIQISTIDYCIIEAPKTVYKNKNNNGNQQQQQRIISSNLQRLLNDTSIIKVFCDNFAHKDKVSLGINITNNNTNNDIDNDNNHTKFGIGESIVDLEVIMNQLYGPVKVARGLSKIISLTIAPNVRISKSSSSSTTTNTLNTSSSVSAKNERWKNIKKFVLIEQGKIKPIHNLFHDLSYDELHYAALDAYYTLIVYNYLSTLL